MSKGSRQEYLKVQRARHKRASRAQKGRILTECCGVLGMHRKSAIRALNRRGQPPGRGQGRPAVYGPTVLAPLKAIWLAAGQPCSKRLKAMVALWLPAYERRCGELARDARAALEKISAATIDRLFAPIRARRRRGLSATRSLKRLEGQIPIRTRFQQVDGPGWLEADTVAHCGQSLAGRFVWSPTLSDIFSGWTENRAGWNRSSKQIVRRLREIEESLAFEIEGFDSDNGSEFLNHNLYRYLRARVRPIEFTRSRPYRKNDNAHVEQKQWTHVRQLLGYDRLEKRCLVEMVNDLYRNEWRLFQNFFQPTMQLVSKSREGGRLRRHHGVPRTPYARLMESPVVQQESKARLRAEFERLDPFELHDAVQRKLRAIFRRARGRKRRERTGRRASRRRAAAAVQ